MEKKFKRTTVTSALPYANGPVHIGHLAGVYVPADIYVRYLRLKKEDVLFIGGSDEHGVPITIRAKKEGITPQDVVDRYHTLIKKSFEEFGISFDVYSRTSSKTHHELASDFFKKLYEKGEFIVNTSFRDSTTFLVQARTKRGFAGVDIVIDTPQYPATSHKSPFHDGTATFMEDYLLNTRDQYYMKGGMRVYNLKEVVVTGSRKKASSESIYTGGINTYTIEGDRLEGFGAQTAFDAVTRLPGISVTNGNEIHIRNNPEQPVIVVDDVVYEDDNDILTMIQTSDMSSLSLLRGADAAILGSRGSAGAIVITLKDGKDIPARPAQGIITCTPLGYSDSVEFYHPTYDTPEKKNDQRSDLRSTIYWNPTLQLDANGKATIEYYTPDSTAPEDITIEGVDKNGKVCRIIQTINNR